VPLGWWPCYFRSCAMIHFVLLDLFILKNIGAAIIDFRVCPPLAKCQNILFSGFIDTLMYGPYKDSVCSKRGTTEILWNCLLA
jgi:hypothetical protein